MSDRTGPKPAKPSKWKVSTKKAPTILVVEKTAAMGIQVGTATWPGTATSVPIYADLHQRKHVVDGDWPGETPAEGAYFKSALVSRKNLALLQLVAASVPWATHGTRFGGFDYMLDTAPHVVGLDGETTIWVQGGKGKDAKGDCFTFHIIPIGDGGTDAKMLKSAKARGDHAAINIENLV